MILIVQDYDNDETTDDAIIERFKSISLIHCQHTY